MSLYESFDFLKEVSGLLKLDFTLTEFGGTFFADFFPDVFFLGSRRKLHRKKTRRNSVSENSIKVKRNTSRQERWKNEAKPRHS